MLDLIPRSNAQLWLKHLRHSTPTLPFLSSASSHQRTNISSSTVPSLIKLLKVYKPKDGSITIGVVGYPNVGKSSLINSLKRSKVWLFHSYWNNFFKFPNDSMFRYVLSQRSQAIRKTCNRSNSSVERVSLTLQESFLTRVAMMAKEARKVTCCSVMSSRWKTSRTSQDWNFGKPDYKQEIFYRFGRTRLQNIQAHQRIFLHNRREKDHDSHRIQICQWGSQGEETSDSDLA